MIASDLMPKWGKISEESELEDYKALRISSECCSEILLAVNPDRCRCLILSLPLTFQIDFIPVKMDKISIELVRNKKYKYVVLTLYDPIYHDLFDDLIVSLHNAIKDIEEVDQYSKNFILTFRKWSQFFEEENLAKLTKNSVQGLFGELLILNSLLLETTASKVNYILEAWKGPYDLGHDFVLNDRDIEVKTKIDDRQSIRISSEHQLESMEKRNLDLAVVSVNFDLINGESIGSLIEKIKDIVNSLLGDISILLKALKQKDLNFSNVKRYDNWRFKALDVSIYDCLNPSFPKIIQSEINSSISRVSYNINLRDLDDYISITKEF